MFNFHAGELEKCLEELESEHGYAQRLGDVYEKVESERNQLLDELDMAFQDLQLYMQKQVNMMLCEKFFSLFSVLSATFGVVS